MARYGTNYLRLLLALAVHFVITESQTDNVSTQANPTLGRFASLFNDTINTTVPTSTNISEIWNSSTSPDLSTIAGTGENEMGFGTNASCTQLCRKCSAQEAINEIPRETDGKIPLYISAYYPGPGGGWDGSGCVPAADMAFDDINSRTDLLPRYELRPIWNDTKCDAGTGSRALFDQLFHEPTKIIIFGEGCSPPTRAIASTAHYWNLVTISYCAESPGLSDRKFYPYFFRSISLATVYNYARIRLLKEFGWRRVATIHENRDIFKLGIDHMHDLLKEANITLVTSESFSTNPRNQIESIKKKDVKIIICNMYEDMARKVFCEAYKQGITGKGYVWLMMGWYEDKFWESDDIDCTQDEMRHAVVGFIGVESTLLNDPSVITVANMTSTQYVSRLKERLRQPENHIYGYEPYGSLAYDGVWIIGLMLHEASLRLKEMNSSKGLEDFNYNDSEMKDLFFGLLANVEFEGVSGPISFINGDRIGVIQIEQLQELVSNTIVYHDIRKDQLRWVSNFTWQDNEIPLDHTPEIVITYKRVQSGISSYIYFIMFALSLSGSIAAISFLLFNIKFREQRYIKMSCPNLNNIIIVGSLLIYIWVDVSGIDNTLVSDWGFTLACQVRVWLLSVGFVLSFGAMFSKTWRVYRVAAFKTPKRRIITDKQLLLLVVILLIIDLVILTLWQVISPHYIATVEGYERDDPTVTNQKLLPFIDYCTCSWITYWLVALCGYKGLLLLFGMFLAWETRQVQISALNDSKLIGISVYNVVILCTIGGAISLIIDDPSTLYIFTASIVLFCTTLTLCTIFVPKIISVYKYPEGEPISTIRNNSNASMSMSKDTTGTTNSNLNIEVVTLRKRVIQLEEMLRKSQGGTNFEDIDITLNNGKKSAATGQVVDSTV